MALVLELAGVSHWYGAFRALTDVELRLEVGPIGLVGQNGAGKSTLMQILLGLIRPTQGQARVLGLDARTAGMKLRSRVGYMPDRNALIPGLNGIEYVALAGEMCGMARRQALRRAHETLSHLGLEDARYRRLDQYSLGMSQRLKLAATLVHDPDLMLLDEPTSGLDPEGRAAMLNLLGTLAHRPGKSLLLASHLLGDIERVCGSAIILDQGRVLSVGRIETLRAARQRGYRLRWDNAGAAFLDSLRSQGVRIEASRELADRSAVGGEARVIVPADWQTREFFAAAMAHGVTLQMLAAEEEDLDAVYHRLIGGATGRSTGNAPAAVPTREAT